MKRTDDKGDARWARTRERLLQGGREAFAKHGVEGASVLDIVRAARVSQPSFYNHFASKEALALEIAAQFFRKDRQDKLAVFAEVDDPAEAIAINVFQTLEIVTTDPVIAWTLIKSETLRSLVISTESDPLAKMIATGIESGRFQANDPRIVALAIRGGAFAVMQDLLNSSAHKAARESFQQLVLCMLGLTLTESTGVVARANKRIKINLAAVA